MKLTFFEYNHEIVKNGKKIEKHNEPNELTNSDEAHKYSYSFMSKDKYLINFSASSDIGYTIVNDFHLEMSKIEPKINLTVEEFVIYEKEINQFLILQKTNSINDFDKEYLKDTLIENHGQEMADKILSYQKQKENDLSDIENFVYPICTKEDLSKLFNHIKSLNMKPYEIYDIELSPDLEQKLSLLIIEQNIIKNNNSLIEYDNNKNATKAFNIFLEERQEQEFENDTTLEDTIAQMNHDNLSVGQKMSIKVNNIFKK